MVSVSIATSQPNVNDVYRALYQRIGPGVEEAVVHTDCRGFRSCLFSTLGLAEVVDRARGIDDRREGPPSSFLMRLIAGSHLIGMLGRPLLAMSRMRRVGIKDGQCDEDAVKTGGKSTNCDVGINSGLIIFELMFVCCENRLMWSNRSGKRGKGNGGRAQSRKEPWPPTSFPTCLQSLVKTRKWQERWVNKPHLCTREFV